MKIGCVHTGAGHAIFGIIEDEIKRRLQEPCVITHVTDPDLISRISQNQKIGPREIAQILRMYSLCADEGCDVILNMCSSVGEVADAAKELFALAEISVVRIDHQMCVEAAGKYSRIAVAATLASTMQPSCALLERCAKEQGRHIEVLPILIDGAFGLDKDALAERIYALAAPKLESFDALVLAQNSMTESAALLSEKLKKPVLASPAYAAWEIAQLAVR